MNQSNRVQDYYELACDFLSLPINARFLIGTHFKLLPYNGDIPTNKDQMDEEIFREIFKQDIFIEFKKFTQHFKKSRDNGYSIH